MTVAVLACMLACLAHIAAGPIAARPNWLGAAIGNSLNLRLLTPAVPLRPKLEGKPTTRRTTYTTHTMCNVTSSWLLSWWCPSRDAKTDTCAD